MMIKNERQYRITGAQAEKFRVALAQAKSEPPPAGVHPRMHQASIDGMASQLETLERELHAYEELRSGRVKYLGGDISELATVLIEARIARGWTQRELGERLGLDEQKIQQYESGGYASASVTRVLEIIEALGTTIALEVTLAQPSTKKPNKKTGVTVKRRGSGESPQKSPQSKGRAATAGARK
jgi:HTH-type transcriptional regulator / antitoxin HigA